MQMTSKFVLPGAGKPWFFKICPTQIEQDISTPLRIFRGFINSLVSTCPFGLFASLTLLAFFLSACATTSESSRDIRRFPAMPGKTPWRIRKANYRTFPKRN